jgi:hypothetical protein
VDNFVRFRVVLAAGNSLLLPMLTMSFLPPLDDEERRRDLRGCDDLCRDFLASD